MFNPSMHILVSDSSLKGEMGVLMSTPPLPPTLPPRTSFPFASLRA
uniref:Uncharacterized protein n=1 Tax=Rhizophora mucronata TaxID=61149 RepID=A0A2P2IT60_RHIMU